MTPLELTGAITAIANALAYQMTTEEITLLASVLVQLGDTLATIATVKGASDDAQSCFDKNKQRFHF